jgi:hypothetical protein
MQKFDSTGVFLTKWGIGPSPKAGNFDNPVDAVIDSCGRIYVVDQANKRIEQFGDPAPCGPNTPVGTNVSVQLSTKVQIRFTATSVEGVTNLDVQSSGPQPPNGILLVPASPPEYYDITTNAAYSGPVEITVAYDPADVQGPEENLLLFRWDASINPPYWFNVTAEVDTLNNLISGWAPGLSVFAVMEGGTPLAVPGIPTTFRLYRSYPNPFSGRAQILFDLPESGPVKIRIFDLQGRVVKNLLQETKDPGRYSAFWAGDNDAGQSVAPGIYFYRLETQSRTDTKKLVKMR